MNIEIDNPLDEEGIIKDAIILYEVWADCLECQYNSYICNWHMEKVEPILKKIAPLYGDTVWNFQIQGDLD